MDPALVALYEDSLALYQGLGHGFELPAEPAGVMIVSDEGAALAAAHEAAARRFPELAPEWLEGEALRAAEPAMGPGLYAYRVAAGRPIGPTAATRAWAERARAAGARIVLGEPARAGAPRRARGRGRGGRRAARRRRGRGGRRAVDAGGDRRRPGLAAGAGQLGRGGAGAPAPAAATRARAGRGRGADRARRRAGVAVLARDHGRGLGRRVDLHQRGAGRRRGGAAPARARRALRAGAGRRRDRARAGVRAAAGRRRAPAAGRGAGDRGPVPGHAATARGASRSGRARRGWSRGRCWAAATTSRRSCRRRASARRGAIGSVLVR